MLCTNCIVIQPSDVVINESQPSSVDALVSLQSCMKQKTKKSQPLLTEIPSYVQVKRKKKKPRLALRDEVKLPYIFDTLWIIARTQVNQTNFELHILSWTGFNYLLCDNDSNSYHKIGYLPSINKSPTSHDTVLELLSQSKVNAEKLGLIETDVVLDMAKYAKRVEVMMNPRYIDLKQFVVLRLGFFHTMFIFIAVIGKRFADAGLRDIVIEANLLGESSIDQMLKGKHYNNAVRILKYLYKAFERLMIDSFKHSKNDQTEQTNELYER